MKFIKLALITASLSFFVIACNDTTNSNQSSTPVTNPTPAATSTARTAAASPSPAADEFAHASAFYGQNCAICHGDTGKGGTVDIEGKKLKVPSLIEGHALKHPDEGYVKQITKGGEGMPAFKDKLKPEEINEMVRYIRQKLQAGAAPASNTNTPPPAPRS